ncbi:Bug family tripartite tricarboxylate transporter substrate binding protein [Variovorax sp. DT-64]|uniref:Bug family tripartite tricarboxylate transporter substrate binding protein n=1 Tax=Variovorax sp. DT-64 TaxID=3396160 RepID=UPI003F1E2696
MNPHFIRRAAIALAAALAAGAALAAYPEQPIKLIVPFPAAGSTDLVARTLAVDLGAALGQQIVVENKSGAGSLIGSEFVAKAQPDGYTILMAGLTNVFLPYVHKDLKWSPVDDFVGIGLVADLPNVIAVNAKTPYQKLSDLIAADKARPGSLSFGSAGVATPSHLVCEMVNHQTKTKLQHVPYKGNAPAVNDLMAGHIPVMCNNLGGTLPYMQSGQIRILAQTGKTRSASVPDVPTFAELGLPGLDAGLWMGLVAPKGTPKNVIDTLNRALAKVLATPAMKEKLAKLGATTLNPSAAAFEERLKADKAAWDPVLKTLDLKTN